MDVAIAEKRAYDFLVRQEEAKQWMEAMLNEKIPGTTSDLIPNCRDGLLLCRLANVFTNNSIKKIHSVKSGSVLEFMALDNLNAFLRACKSVGFPDYNFFTMTDIWEKKNIVKVVACIHALAHYLEKIGNFVKIKDLSKVGLKFNEDEIKKTKEELKGLEEFLPPPPEIPDQDTKEPEEEEDIDELASPDETTVEGEGIKKAEAGKEASFTITAKDSIGNELDHGDEQFQIILFKKDDKKVKITGKSQDLKNGKYTVTYTPEKAGEYEMEIYLLDIQSGDDEEAIEQNKMIIKGCPFTVDVTASKTSDPSKCTLEGVGISASTAGSESKFIINSFDKFGNQGIGGENFTVTLNCPENGTKVDGTVKDIGKGQYEVSYICPKTGVYDLDVKLGEKSISEGKKVTVKDAGVSKPDLCELKVDHSSESLKAGETLNFEIIGKDAHGNVRESGGEKFVATLINTTTGDKVTFDLKDEQNGHYLGSQQVLKSGDYELHVTLNDQNLKGAPKKFKVEDCGSYDPNKCTARLPENLGSIRAGENKKIVVEARDQFGNLRGKGGEDFHVRIVCKTKREIYEDKATIKDNGNGTYDVDFTLEDKGEYVIEILGAQGDQFKNINGFPVENVFVIESGKTDPKKSQLTGSGLKEAISKKQADFKIQTFDAYGNERTTGGDDVKIVFTDKKKNTNQFTAQVEDMKNGIYQISYTHEVPIDTEFETEIIINGTNICKDQPNTLKIKGLKIREIGEDQLSEIHDHDLLNSLINLFKEESNESYIEKIQELREQMIQQIRKNFELENTVKLIAKKVELLIENRVKAEELKQSVGFFGKKKKEDKKEDKKKTQQETENQTNYSHLFYLLQTNPRYLSHCLFMVPSEKVESFLETVILTLYGYAFSPREEYLILNLFKQALQLEVERDNKKCGSFLNNNPILPKMVMTYGRRLQGKQYLQKVLFDKIIDPILQKKSLDLDLNAVKFLKAQVQDKEMDGDKLKFDLKTLTYEQAMKEESVSKEINQRYQTLCDLCTGVLQGMSDNVNEMPYGLRYVCKTLEKMLKVKHPDSTESDRNSVISNIVYYRFMNPALVSPDGFELTKKAIPGTMRTNLLLISKVMTNLTSNAQFEKKVEEHMCIMNDWIKKTEPVYNEFIRKLINVADPEDSLGVDEFMELTQKTNPTITIHLNEIYSTHGLLLKYLHKLAPDTTDPLNILLSKEGMTKAPDELPKDQDEEIKLPLINGTDPSKTNDPTPEQIYEQTKENFRKLLKSLPPEAIGDSVESTLESASEYAQKKGDESSKLLLLYVAQIQKSIPTLVDAKKISKETKYREILIDITKEIQNMKVVLAKQKKEYERLQESYGSLQSHQKYLEEKVADFEEYVNNTMKNEWREDPKKKSQKHNFTYSQLEKKEVIHELKVMKNQRNQVKFTISMPKPGIFQVDAKVLNAVVSTIEINVEDLLHKKSKGVDTIEFEHVILNVTPTLEVMNKLFAAKQ